ncbi:ABC transporter permease [Lysinibacillus telephonicus]|uniref:Iron ABC transporter permease n=1 Tax=Lysinibacillus telephonicus TaxID=1714840 RepID=A0A3S0QU40_9BACI|nr:iron ABC transporter permease [Lysinibacillus telephonicus]RTQ91652.1 iron ABC transporter permease [Lysinibacillus telephonicus]
MTGNSFNDETLDRYKSLNTKKKSSEWFSLLFKNKNLYLSLLIILIVFVIPVIRLFLMSFQANDSFSFENYTNILSEKYTWTVIKNTCLIVVGSTVISLIVGVSLAWIMAYTNIRLKKLMQVFILLPFIIPSYIVTIAWTQFVGNIKAFDINLYSMGGIIFVLGISHYPLVYLFTVNVLKKIPRELEWAVRASGGGQLKAFWHVTVPLALPGIVGGGMIAFLSNLDNFGIPAFLGIPSNITILSTAIYQEVIGFGENAFSRAATFSVLLAVFALFATGIQWFLLRKSKVTETAAADNSPRFYLCKSRPFVEFSIWLFIVGVSIVPLLSMLKTSLLKVYGLSFTLENITLHNFNYLLYDYDKVATALLNSLKLAGLTTLICLIIGTLVAYFRIRKPSFLTKALEVSISIPYTLPGMVLALAMIFTWMQPIPGWNPGIYGSIWILLIAYVTRFMILQVRGSSSAFTQISVDLEEAAHISGASTWSKWRYILLPLILPSVLSGSILVLLTTLTELTISSLLWSSGSETIGVIIFNFEQAGYTTYSTAFSVITLLFMGILAALVYGIIYIWQRSVRAS